MRHGIGNWGDSGVPAGTVCFHRVLQNKRVFSVLVTVEPLVKLPALSEICAPHSHQPPRERDRVTSQASETGIRKGFGIRAIVLIGDHFDEI
jgi:hypothetical protein